MSNQQKRLAKRGGRRKENPNGGIHPKNIATPLVVLRVSARQLKVAKKAILLQRKEEQRHKQAQISGAQPSPEPIPEESVILRASANDMPKA